MLKEEYKNLKILYVEDEELIRTNAISYLKRLFHTVYEAPNATEAFDIIKKNTPHIIISDIKMPEINGLDMIRQIRKYDKKTKFIVLSAYTDTKYLLDAIDLGLVKYLTKPIQHETLYPLLLKCAAEIFENQDNIKYFSQESHYDTISENLMQNSEMINITKNERLFLNLLLKNHPRAVSYDELQTHIWQDEYMSENAIRLLVRDLRKKLPQNCIKNLSGIGYKIELL